MKTQHSLRRMGILAVLLACAARAGGPAFAPPTFSAEQLRVDVDALAKALRDMPPDLAHTADPAKVWEALVELRKQIGAAPLDRDAVWRLFATINPLLGDGHLFVGFVDWRADARAHLKSGGKFFPFEMQVSPDGALFVARGLGGQARGNLRRASEADVNDSQFLTNAGVRNQLHVSHELVAEITLQFFPGLSGQDPRCRSSPRPTSRT